MPDGSEPQLPEPHLPESHLRGLFGRDLIYASLYVSQLVIVAISTPVLTRLMPRGQFGTVSACMTVLQLLVVVSTWRMDLGVQRTFAADGETAARKVVTFGISIAAALFILELGTGRWWSPAIKLGAFHGAIAYTTIWALLMAATAVCLAVIRSRDKLRQYAIVTITQTTLAEALSVAFVLIFKRTASEYVLGEMIAQVVALVIALAFARPALLRRLDVAVIIAVFGYASSRLPAVVVDFVDQSSDRLIVNADLGHAQLARYAVAGSLAAFVLVALFSVSESWMPRSFSIDDPEALREVVAKARDRLTLLALPVVLGMCAISDILLRIWMPPSYRPDHLQLIVALIVFTVFPAIGDVALWQIYTRASAKRALPLISISTAALNVLLNVVLVPIIGLAGSVIATLVATSAEYVLLRRRLAASERLSRPNTALVRDAALFCGTGVGVCLLPTSTPFLVLRLLLALGAACLALATLASLTGRGGGRLVSWAQPWVAAHT